MLVPIQEYRIAQDPTIWLILLNALVNDIFCWSICVLISVDMKKKCVIKEWKFIFLLENLQ